MSQRGVSQHFLVLSQSHPYIVHFIAMIGQGGINQYFTIVARNKSLPRIYLILSTEGKTFNTLSSKLSINRYMSIHQIEYDVML